MKPKTKLGPKPGFAAALAILACAGCSSTTADTGPGVSGAIDTGTYPNLNVPPPVATQQFDGESLRAHNAALGSARAGQNQDSQEAAALARASNVEQARLKRLARSQRDTLKQIEGKQ